MVLTTDLIQNSLTSDRFSLQEDSIEAEVIKQAEKIDNQKTMLIGENWYYWNEDKKQWMAEYYKFEETK